MKTIIAGIFFLCSIIPGLPARAQESNTAAYKAYIGEDIKVTKTLWKKIAADSEATVKHDTKNQHARYLLALAQFGLLSSTMRDRDEDLFDAYYGATEENLEALLSANKNHAEARALLSATYGLKMGFSSIQGMFLGPKSGSLMDKARKDGASSALVWKLYGNAKLHTPETWGGDVKEAIKAFQKSIELYEASPGKTKENWFYLDTLVFLGKAYEKDKQPAKAIETYEKALRVEPAFGWVKHSLLPQARKSTSAR